MTTKPATEIEVKAFHHTLIWPLLMRGEAVGADNSIDRFVKAFEGAGWTEQTHYASAVHADHGYPEIVYFHPFVRDFLFGDGEADHKKRAIRRFTRQGNPVTGVDISINTGRTPLQDVFNVLLRVERTELLLIRPLIAILVIEVSNRKTGVAQGPDPKLDDPRTSLTLDQVQFLQSQLRHIYPPYFDAWTQAHGDCPRKVEWLGLVQPPSLNSNSQPAEFDAFVRPGAEPPMYAHWRAFFGQTVQPLSSAADRKGDGLFLQQLLDDRMPAMSFVAVDDPAAIHLDDEDRFPAFDPPGLDYDPGFRGHLREAFRYTRFRHWDTTYYCNGTSFSMVCNTGSFSNLLLLHFRRQYLHLGVIAHFQHAALLYFADELADIAKDLAGEDDEKSEYAWRVGIRKLQHKFLKFRTRSYFIEVSNQMQGKDLFRLWFDRLGTQALFDRVAQTSAEVYEALENHEMLELTKSQKDLAEAQNDLSKAQRDLAEIATWGLAISIILTAASAVFAWVAIFPESARANLTLSGSPIGSPWLALLLALSLSILSIALLRHFSPAAWKRLQSSRNST